VKTTSRWGTMALAPMTSEEIAKMLKLLVNNTRSIDAIFGVINDYACLIEVQLPRCVHIGCDQAATVRHASLKVDMCDAHAAVVITKAIKNVTLDCNDQLDFFRALVANEELWLDMPNAVRIRRLTDYVSMLQRDDERAPPADPNQLH
jgi:hypothetical protein